MPHVCVTYGYGAGADPAACDSHGYGEGPLPLVGLKQLPVLTGVGVPSPAWVRELPRGRVVLPPCPARRPARQPRAAEGGGHSLRN